MSLQTPLISFNTFASRQPPHEGSGIPFVTCKLRYPANLPVHFFNLVLGNSFANDSLKETTVYIQSSEAFNIPVGKHVSTYNLSNKSFEYPFDSSVDLKTTTLKMLEGRILTFSVQSFTNLGRVSQKTKVKIGGLMQTPAFPSML